MQNHFILKFIMQKIEIQLVQKFMKNMIMMGFISKTYSLLTFNFLLPFQFLNLTYKRIC